MQKNQANDITSKGLAAGLLIPFIIMLVIYAISSRNFDTIADTIAHYQNFGITYKLLSMSLMPSAGLFFYWSNNNKINQARGTLLATLFYGVLVLVLYFS